MKDWRQELKKEYYRLQKKGDFEGGFCPDIDEYPDLFDMDLIFDWMMTQIQQAKIEALKKVPTGTFDSTPYVKEMISSLEEQ